jgi:hypothetical protein
MTNQLFFAAFLLVLGTPNLTAQAPAAALHLTSTPESAVNALVGQLNQNALWVLAGIVALMGLAWLCFIGGACAELPSKNKNTRRPSLFVLLCLATGLSTLGSSCAVAQLRPIAGQPAAPRTPEGGPCTCHPFCNNYQPAPGYGAAYNQSSYRFSNGTGTGLSFCKHCGRPLHNH